MEENNAFYVVRKGDIVGVYKNFSDCQDQLSTSVSDPAVSIYKGHSLHKETEVYLSARGLRNPSYVINAADLKDDLFGELVPCSVEPDERISASRKRPFNEEAMGRQTEDIPKKLVKLEDPVKGKSLSLSRVSCIVEFDGASKGNPGKAGAGAIIRLEDGTILARLREGLGVATNNVAEYRAIILGMRLALQKGFTHIRVVGDSQLVCNQVLGRWQTKHPNLLSLCKEAKELKDRFDSCMICHVEREFNSDADREANLAIHLAIGEVYDSHSAG
ncbi:uncharacterized protein LOC144700152 isoform X2 [Wolffia australiana]